MQTTSDQSTANAFIQHYYGYSLDDLMAPIGDSGVGDSVRHNGVYFDIKEFRREDDATLPQGIWSHEMKIADWEAVEKTALNALCRKSKDLQLGVWLFESSIHRYGFGGIAPAAILIYQLCKRYWDQMHPQMVDGDVEYRTNPINWINEKLLVPLRLLPITQASLDNREMCWNDWEEAQRFDQLQRQRNERLEWNGPTKEAFRQHLAATPGETFKSLWHQLDQGLNALDELISWLDQTCAEDSPSLSDICELLDQIQTMVAGELKRRGINLAQIYGPGDDDETQQGQSGNPPPAGDHSSDDAGGDGHTGGSGGGNGPLRNRADAFATLYKVAEFLMQDDPHSPVPYLIYTACQWGEKTAPDLYQELFMEKGGNLNIFEVMGLSINQE
ncbi:type VI secretion system protein TssA [Oceanobacter mangrovi]|uniref:type VI secretion system protein TssA n=1 Tax=Oceanobacter mangrovi TaxID=2862510 RepID=UPI001C8E322E|nr:type VI secretion system protein TssA [Oceanobacter mangrovi]